MLWVPQTASTQGARAWINWPVLLSQTAPYGDLQLRAAALEDLEVAEMAVQLVVGVLPDTAGVEHDHVGVVEPSAATIPSFSSIPTRRSESCSFIWQPKVRTK